MRVLITVIFLLFSIKSVCSVCNNRDFLDIEKEIQIQKEKIADNILDKYGDVPTALNKLLFELNNTTSLKAKEIQHEKEINEQLKKKGDYLNNETGDLFKFLNNLDGQLGKLDIRNIDLNDFEIHTNDSSKPDILAKIEKMEDQLAKWDKLTENLNKTNIYKNIMNIPHSVSEDLSFIENYINKEKDSFCKKEIEEIEDELKKLFKELATLLNFEGIIEDVLDLNEALFNFILNKVETSLKQLLINTQQDLGLLIEEAENEIKVYSNNITCYSEYIEQCNSESPTNTTYIPKCMDGCDKM